MTVVRIIVAADAFAKTIDGVMTSQLLADGVQTAAPLAEVDVWAFPPAGRTLHALQRALGGEFQETPVVDAFWQPTRLTYLVVGEGSQRTAYVETDWLFPGLNEGTADEVYNATSFGLGEALLHLMIAGMPHIVLIIGKRMICDGGIGMLQALGAVIGDDQGQDVGSGRNPLLVMQGIDASRPALLLRKVDLTIMTDNYFTYTGKQGFVGLLAAHHHFTSAQQRELDRQLAAAQQLLADTCHIPIRDVPGSGAGGGIGGALLAVGARQPVDFAPWLGEQVGFMPVLAQADLVITAAPVLTPVMGLMSGVVPLARVAQAHQVPIVLALQPDHTPDPGLSELFADIYLTRVTGLMGSERSGVWRRGLKVAGSELVTRFEQRRQMAEK